MKLDSKLYKTADFIYKMILINILMIVGSLGVFTIGASISAAFLICIKLIDGEDIYIVREFFSVYKKKLISGSLITVIFLLIFGLLSYNIGIITQNRLFIYLNYFLKLHLTTTMFLSLFVIARSDIKIKTAIIYSFGIINKNLYVVIPFLVIPYLHMILIKYLFIVFVLFGGSVTMLISTVIFYPLLKKMEMRKINGK